MLREQLRRGLPASFAHLLATLSAVLIDGGDAIAGAPAEGVTAIEALVRTAAAAPRPFELVVDPA